MSRLCAHASFAAAHSNSCRQLVKACHQRGIEVILDVVFNHTAEGSEAGPTLSFRWVGGRRESGAGLFGLISSCFPIVMSSYTHVRDFQNDAHDP